MNLIKDLGTLFLSQCEMEPYSRIFMKQVFLIILGLNFLHSCGGNRESNIPAGASLIFDASTINSVSSPTGTCNVTSWIDSSGSGNTGTINCAGGGGFSGTGIPTDPNRIIFNGNSTFISTPLNAQPNTMLNSTWIIWVKPTTTGFSHILSIDDHAGTFNRSLVIDNTTADYGVFNRFNNTWITTAVDLGAWQFLAVVFTPTNLLFYKNGSSANFGNPPSYNSTIQTLTIGRSAGGPFDYFNGAIAWVAVYPRALSSSEIMNSCQALLPRFSGASCN